MPWLTSDPVVVTAHSTTDHYSSRSSATLHPWRRIRPRLSPAVGGFELAGVLRADGSGPRTDFRIRTHHGLHVSSRPSRRGDRRVPQPARLGAVPRAALSRLGHPTASPSAVRPATRAGHRGRRRTDRRSPRFGFGWRACAELDLTFASRRAVSPVHLEYTRNMGVAATATISVVQLDG